MAGAQSAHNTSSSRLVRTAHTEDGTSVFAEDTRLESFHPFGPQLSGFTIFDIRQSIPVNNTDSIPSFANTLPRCPPGGAIFCITQIQPGGRSPMHRTQSIDYGVILSGEIVLALDGGEEKVVKTGEFIVQQGVNHQWINRTEAPCQILCVLIGAEKVTLKDGTVLEEDVFGKK